MARCAIRVSANVQWDGVHQFLAIKEVSANEANLFCVVGQDIFVSALLDGPMIMPSRDRSPVVVLDHDLHEPTDLSPIIETFSLAITFPRDSGSNHTPKLMVRRGLTRSTLSRSDLVHWHFSAITTFPVFATLSG